MFSISLFIAFITLLYSPNTWVLIPFVSTFKKEYFLNREFINNGKTFKGYTKLLNLVQVKAESYSPNEVKNNRNAFNEVIQMQREMYLNTSTLFNKHELIETSSELLGCSKLRLKIHDTF